MAKNKKAKPVVEKKTKRSEIIEQCVIYAQSIAAYNAGFYVDSTDDFDYAGCGSNQHGHDHFRNAKRALIKLVALGGDVPALSRDEYLRRRGWCVYCKTPTQNEARRSMRSNTSSASPKTSRNICSYRTPMGKQRDIATTDETNEPAYPATDHRSCCEAAAR
jgi:hypothetical protein